MGKFISIIIDRNQSDPIFVEIVNDKGKSIKIKTQEATADGLVKINLDKRARYGMMESTLGIDIWCAPRGNRTWHNANTSLNTRW